MASREQARIEQDEAEQALRSLGMTPSAENRLQASLVNLPAVIPAASVTGPSLRSSGRG